MLSDAKAIKRLIRLGNSKSRQGSKSEIALDRTELTSERLLDEKGSTMRIKRENSLQVKQTIFL